MSEKTCTELNCFPHHPAECMLTKYDELAVNLRAVRLEINRALLQLIKSVAPDRFSGAWLFMIMVGVFTVGIVVGASW